jgi:5'-methylthioadenosine phosphorylase
VALVSDYDCWKPHGKKKNKQTLLKEIIANLKTATDNCLKLIEAVLKSDGELVSEDCYCRHSLDLAVWTDQKHIEAADKGRLKVLFE